MMNKNGSLIQLSRVTSIQVYYSWLCDLIDVDQSHRPYYILTKLLHRKKFYWTVPNDDNRAYEGKNLREKFCEDMDVEYNDDHFDVPCSMLELIIGLAYRCESIMVDQGLDMDMVDWFWKLIDNIGLCKFTDNYIMASDTEIINKTLDKIIERKYDRNGNGGLFPLKHAKKDQRKVELWYQMS